VPAKDGRGKWEGFEDVIIFDLSKLHFSTQGQRVEGEYIQPETLFDGTDFADAVGASRKLLADAGDKDTASTPERVASAAPAQAKAEAEAKAKAEAEAAANTAPVFQHLLAQLKEGEARSGAAVGGGQGPRRSIKKKRKGQHKKPKGTTLTPRRNR